VPHAPVRRPGLNQQEKKQAIRNALRYIPESLHEKLAPEFADELAQYGHIYMYRFKPQYRITSYPQHWYPTKTPHAACLIHNIMNNLDPEVAQFPE
jgi:urocanate hydratase